MSATLLLLEDYRGEPIPAGADLVALTVSAQWALTKAGLPHATPSDFIDTGAMWAREDEYTRLQLDWFAAFDERYVDVEVDPGVPLSPCRMDGYHFKLVVDSLVVEAARLAAIVKAVGPSRVELVCAPSDPATPCDFDTLVPGAYYPYLTPEVLRLLAAERDIALAVRPAPPDTISRAGVRAVLRASLAGALAARLAHHDAAAPQLPAALRSLHGERVLFASESWGLEPAIAHALATAARTWVFADDVMFAYRGRVPVSARRVRPVRVEVGPRDAAPLAGHAFVTCASSVAGLDLAGPLASRLRALDARTPHLAGLGRSFGGFIARSGIRFVVANQRPSVAAHVLAYVATTSPGVEYWYATHGYDTYEVDRTFLELPCDRYLALDAEYAAYVERAFAAQTLFSRPTVEAAPLE